MLHSAVFSPLVDGDPMDFYNPRWFIATALFPSVSSLGVLLHSTHKLLQLVCILTTSLVSLTTCYVRRCRRPSRCSKVECSQHPAANQQDKINSSTHFPYLSAIAAQQVGQLSLSLRAATAPLLLSFSQGDIATNTLPTSTSNDLEAPVLHRALCVDLSSSQVQTYLRWSPLWAIHIPGSP